MYESKTICESKTLDRITIEVLKPLNLTNQRTQFTIIKLPAETDQNERDDRSWVKRHPMLFGSMLGFGIGFAIGVGSGSGSDFSAGTKGIYVGAIGAGIGALIGNIAS